MTIRKAASGKMKGILKYSEDKLVSSDIIGDSCSSIFDSSLTQVNGKMVKVLSWYDNEFGYSSRLVDLLGKL
jgi:glyceraldehyde 3-phosphate dehydrogenase